MTTGTVAVCTRDRATVLPQCLASLDAQLTEPGLLEVLVVDNGSTDAAPACCATGGKRAPTRWERLRRAADEVRETREALAARGQADPDDLAPVVRMVVHASAALELLRSSVAPRP
jgi:hypothetical protein